MASDWRMDWSICAGGTGPEGPAGRGGAADMVPVPGSSLICLGAGEEVPGFWSVGLRLRSPLVDINGGERGGAGGFGQCSN